MAECEESGRPGPGAYAQAAGTGLLTRLAAPFVGLGVALGLVASAPPPTTPEETKVRLGMAGVIGGLGTAAGIVAGPFVASHAAAKTLRDRHQDLFERCLVARGYLPPPTGIAARRVLVLVEHEHTPPSAVAAFRDELERRGYVFGTTLHVDVQWWNGPRASAGVFVPPWDIAVVASGRAAVSVQRTLPRVPIVVAGSELDMVAVGLADSADEPRRNVSGVTLAASELDASRLELLVATMPNVRHVAVLVNPDNAAHTDAIPELRALKPELTLRRVEVRAETDLDRVFRELSAHGVEALLVLSDRLLMERRNLVASLALRERLPAIAGDVGFASAGGLLEYHPALDATWREAAGFVDRIVKGAAVGSLPIRTVAERDIIVNESTAEALSLPRVTARATQVVR